MNQQRQQEQLNNSLGDTACTICAHARSFYNSFVQQVSCSGKIHFALKIISSSSLFASSRHDILTFELKEICVEMQRTIRQRA